MSVTDKAEQHGKKVSRSGPFRFLVGLGIVGVGVVHILIGVLALRLAWGSGGEEASNEGAFSEIGKTPFGGILLWALGVVLIAVALWKLSEAAWGFAWEDKKSKRIRKRIGSLGGAIVYGFLAVSAIRFAVGDGSKSGDEKKQTYVGELLSKPFGVVLACLVAVGILVYAGVQVKRAVSGSFTEQLDGEPSAPMKRLGQIGYFAKGIGMAVIGVLVAWAALSYDPEKAGGMDDALKTIKDQPAGPILLTLVALGLIAFGVYCFSWARRARHS